MASNSFWDTGLGKFLNIITFGIPRIIQGISQPAYNSDGSSNTAFGIFNEQNWKNTAGDILLGDDYQNTEPLGQQLFGTNLGGLIQSLTNRITANELTGAEREANAFSAGQAQIDRAFQERMANTQYQRGVADMRAAGVNPALVIGQGGAAAPSGQAAASVQPQGQGLSMSDLMHLMLIKPQMDLMRAQSDAVRKQGDAALAGAEASKISAGAQARNADTAAERLSTVEQPLARSQVAIGKSVISLNAKSVEKMDKEIGLLSEDISLTQLHQLATSLDIAWKGETWEDSKQLLTAQIGKTISAASLDYALRSKAISEKELNDLQKDIDAKDKFINEAIVEFLKNQPGTGWIQNEINKGSSWQSLLHGYGVGIIDALDPSDFDFTKSNFIGDVIGRGIVKIAAAKNRP